MNEAQFTQARSDLIRAELQRTVEATRRVRRSPHRKRWGIAVFAIAGVVSGGTVAAAATSGLFWPHTEPNPLPGAPAATALTDISITEGTGDLVIELPSQPADATHFSVVFTCRSSGTFVWGFDPSGNNPSTACQPGEMSSHNFPITADSTKFHVTTTDDQASWSIASRYVQTRTEALGVNEHGETYGVAGDGSNTPDLIAVIGVADDGTAIEGYARASDMEQPMPSSPEEALRSQEEHQAKHPNGREVPVYKSDGTTRIGTFTIG
ncbi:DUF4175 domain-containing protein [Salinibacterium sp. ZJ450]|uniref:DUF4175 domain-containing protein n=1 Tax=Salinibacterium sp. ZJ450 TaxID=2708338 RepID=UPI0014225593|nr:DUF4175 domain-containing protein [Salinibacterium sp. ZJ450]